jgi:Tfp pilus assembly protein PilO
MNSTAIQHVVRHPLVIAGLVALALAAAGLAGMAALVWHPARVEARAAETGLDEAAFELRELRYRARLAQEYASRLVEVQALEAKLSLSKPEPEFVRDIEELAARTGASIAQFSSRSTEQDRGAGSASFEFFLNGTYANLRRFMALLPGLKEFVAIERVSLERNGPAVRAFLVLQRRHRVVNQP